MPETILEPDLPILDPHHHLWDRTALLAQLPPPQHGFDQVIRRRPRYMADELVADMKSGHNVRATIFVDCGAMYRADGPQELKSLGETEFVNGVAAIGASGQFGDVRPCAGIVGNVALSLGARTGEILDQHVALSGGRFKGLRNSASYDPDPDVLGARWRAMQPGVYLGKPFREGFAELAKRNLSFDAWLLEPQLPDIIDLARAFPDTRIVLDHVGTPLGIGTYQGKREERFAGWRKNMSELAKSENVFVKLGGLAMPFCGFEFMLGRSARAFRTIGARMEALYRSLHRSVRRQTQHVREQFPGRCRDVRLPNSMERVQAYRREVFGVRKSRAVCRHGGGFLSRDELGRVA